MTRQTPDTAVAAADPLFEDDNENQGEGPGPAEDSGSVVDSKADCDCDVLADVIEVPDVDEGNQG